MNYSKFDIVRTGFLKHVKRLGQLVNPDGQLNTGLIKGYDAECFFKIVSMSVPVSHHVL